MKKLYKCKVCGFISERNDPLDVCPACGFKGKIFEEYESPISTKRRKAIERYAHPIMVHFPIAFVFSMLLISFFIMIDIIDDQSVFMDMLRAIILIMPFVAISSMITGIYDGKLRFKRINTPHLKKKLVLAGFFIIISISLFIIQYFLDINHSSYNLIVLMYSIVLSGLGGTLGLIGGRLIESKVRG